MGDENGMGEDLTPDEKIGAFIVLACILCVIGFVVFFIWGM